MKAISLWQPWATLIAILAKEFETRSWATTYRGPIVIHAAKTQSELMICYTPTFQKALHEGGYDNPKLLPFGAAVCVAELVDCQRMTPTYIASRTSQERAFGLWQPGRFAWQFANVRRFKTPFPMRGAQGIFNCEIPAALLDLAS